MSVSPERKLVFVSHANPEDNDFARWLCLKLAQHGYQVWSDVTQLLGGEIFWSDIQDAIKEHAIKFVFVFSRHSINEERGAYKELHLAERVGKAKGISDFIVPVRIGDIPFSDRPILIEPLNVIDFSDGWASGLTVLFKKLDKDDVPRTIDRGMDVVSSWWKTHVDTAEKFGCIEGVLLSNWYELRSYPDELWIHEVADSSWKDVGHLPFPAFSSNKRIFSFSSSFELGLSPTESSRIRTCHLLSGDLHFSNRFEAQNIIKYLFRQAWNSFAKGKGLRAHHLANGVPCHYFHSGILPSKERVLYQVDDLIQTKRSLYGKAKQYFWHFGVSVDVQFVPFLSLIVRPHVLFSSDGLNVLDSHPKLASLRRSVCKDWWNDIWRDRTGASMQWLSGGPGKEISIPMSSTYSDGYIVSVSSTPIRFITKHDYDDEIAQATSLDDIGDYDYSEDIRDEDQE